MTAVHPIPPVWDARSEILILGSFPSVKSREEAFFYAHPQNRFWRVLASLLGEAVPQTVEEKKRFLLHHRIALWDVVASCTVRGSADASLRDVRANDIGEILRGAPIRAIFTNGAAASALYHKHIEPLVRRPARRLPSTSPANAAVSEARLVELWREILETGDLTHEN